MATPTQKQQLDAAWERLKVWNNVSMPAVSARLAIVLNKLR